MYRFILLLTLSTSVFANDYRSLLPSPSEIKVTKKSIPDLGRLLKDKVEPCLNTLNHELTHRQKQSAQSGSMFFEVTTQNLRVVKVSDKDNQFRGKTVRDCVKDKISQLSLSDQYSKKKVIQQLRVDIQCRLKRTEKNWAAKDKLDRLCRITPIQH